MASSENINGVELRHHSVRANGILQHYVVAGSGEPVVLLHGFAQTWRMWRRDVIPALARDILSSRPTCGGSGIPSGRPPGTRSARWLRICTHFSVTWMSARSCSRDTISGLRWPRIRGSAP